MPKKEYDRASLLKRIHPSNLVTTKKTFVNRVTGENVNTKTSRKEYRERLNREALAKLRKQAFKYQASQNAKRILSAQPQASTAKGFLVVL